MPLEDLKNRYGRNCSSKVAITKGVRAEIPGGDLFVDTFRIVNERNNRRGVSRAVRSVVDLIFDDLDAANKMMRIAIASKYEMAKYPDPQYSPRYKIPPVRPEPWYVPIYNAWIELGSIDFARTPADAADFANEIKMRLQDILQEIEEGPDG